ncbi:MAG: hypothetical protein Q8K86_05890 [Candidatus Nanopelagicaceae bacterium]|nr:hypothetical protein [Candidatus Nanopelagicaceae bacterium]
MILLLVLGGWYGYTAYENKQARIAREKKEAEDREAKKLEAEEEAARQKRLAVLEEERLKREAAEQERFARLEQTRLLAEQEADRKRIQYELEQKRREEETRLNSQKRLLEEESRRLREEERKREAEAREKRRIENVKLSPTFKERIRRAMSGDVEEMYQLAVTYENELEDTKEAANWYARAHKTCTGLLPGVKKEASEQELNIRCLERDITRWDTEFKRRRAAADADMNRINNEWEQRRGFFDNDRWVQGRVGGSIMAPPDTRDIREKHRQTIRAAELPLQAASEKLPKCKTDLSEAKRKVEQFERIIGLVERKIVEGGQQWKD